MAVCVTTRRWSAPFRFSWKIYDFHLALQAIYPEAVRSTVFPLKEDLPPQWQVVIYPKGRVAGQHTAQVILRLNFTPLESPRYHSQVVSNIKYKIHGSDQHEFVVFERGPMEYSRSHAVGGPAIFISVAELMQKRNELLPNGRLTIVCEGQAEVSTTLTTPLDRRPLATPYNVGPALFNEYLFSDKFSDLTLIVHGVRIPAHKMVLSFRCPFFKTTLSAAGNSQVLEITGFHPEVVKKVLAFIYTGQEPPDLKDTAVVMMDAAGRFQLRDLHVMCQGALTTNVNANNVILYLDFAIRHEANELRQFCIQKAAQHLEDIRNTRAWQNFKIMHSNLAAEIQFMALLASG